jgi:hypothetical protein
VAAGGRAVSQLVTWSPAQGAKAALPEITDGCALFWSASDESWQLLSPIFGVLLLQEAAASERAVLPVAPLLEAAVARQLAGARAARALRSALKSPGKGCPLVQGRHCSRRTWRCGAREGASRARRGVPCTQHTQHTQRACR